MRNDTEAGEIKYLDPDEGLILVSFTVEELYKPIRDLIKKGEQYDELKKIFDKIKESEWDTAHNSWCPFLDRDNWYKCSCDIQALLVKIFDKEDT